MLQHRDTRGFMTASTMRNLEKALSDASIEKKDARIVMSTSIHNNTLKTTISLELHRDMTELFSSRTNHKHFILRDEEN